MPLDLSTKNLKHSSLPNVLRITKERGNYLFASEVTGASVLGHSSLLILLGSEKGILQINGESSGSGGADSYLLSRPLLGSSLPSIAGALVQQPDFCDFLRCCKVQIFPC